VIANTTLFFVREAKRLAIKEADKKYSEAMNSGDIEKMALAIGIKLK